MADSWIVDVVEPAAIETVDGLTLSFPGWSRRYTFIGEDAAVEAWTCLTKAEEAGFEARCEKVKRVAPVLEGA